ncbi:MAG: GAF domain-containing sensor histidine kinase [Caldilineaceae bacterium]|nr:GAF domain-containing sensor histidine kinase [Caldilineaceae bacterium]
MSAIATPVLTTKQMAGRSWTERLYRAFFALYTAASLLWLAIGLIPVLAHYLPPVYEGLSALNRALPSFDSDLGQVIFGLRRASRAEVPLPAVLLQYLFSAANLALGLTLHRLRPRDLLSRLLALGLIGTGAILNLQAHVLVEMMWISTPVWLTLWHESLHFVGGSTYTIAILLFPSGQLPIWPFSRPRWQLAPSLRQFLTLFFLVTVGVFGWFLIWASHWEVAAGYVALYGFLVPLVGLSTQWLRFRQATSQAERQILRTWTLALLLAVAAALLVGAVLAVAQNLTLQTATFNRAGLEMLIFTVVPILFVGIPVSMAFLVLRYQLWVLEFAISRSLIYGTLTAAIASLYVLIVVGAGALVQERWHWALTALAVGVVAIVVQPLRQALQTAVNRLLYGERDNPVTALARLGQRLEAAATAEDVLPAIAETVARSLRLPYAAVAVQRDEKREIIAAYGVPSEVVEQFPLTDQGEVVGELLAAPRAAGESFDEADCRLLAQLARQAGPAVHAVLLMEALQRSRERLVTAQEEERRRLRRELHDGLGPQLAGLNLKVDAARNTFAVDPAQSAQLLLEVKAGVQAAIADIRRTVYALRPPALDQLGLIGAVRAQADELTAAAGVETTVVGPDVFPPLPAAAEVAAYRIIGEALTNVARHAQAHSVYVGLCLTDALHLVVEDDGSGLAGDYRAGVGLASMRERAEELGGAFHIRSELGQGVRMEVSLPAGVPKTQ